MYQEERLKQILSIIEEKRIISVEELKNSLYVSTSTVRRDLAELSRRGLVVRSSGGAIAMSEREKSDPLMLDQPLSAHAGNSIGARAAQMISDGETIFLGASSAAMAMVPYLAQRRGLTIVTDSADIISALSGAGPELYCCSGRFAEQSNSFCGTLAAQFLAHFNFHAAYFTCDALTAKGELAYNNLELLELLQHVQTNARRRILLCSRAKIGASVPYNLLDIRCIDTVVTDAPELLQDLPCEVLGTG